MVDVMAARLAGVQLSEGKTVDVMAVMVWWS